MAACGLRQTVLRLQPQDCQAVLTAQLAGIHLSEPARSTKDNLPLVTFWVCRLVASMRTDMMRWDRDDSRFICVDDVCRRCCPFSIVASSSRADVTCEHQANLSQRSASEFCKLSQAWREGPFDSPCTLHDRSSRGSTCGPAC